MNLWFVRRCSHAAPNTIACLTVALGLSAGTPALSSAAELSPGTQADAMSDAVQRYAKQFAVDPGVAEQRLELQGREPKVFEDVADDLGDRLSQVSGAGKTGVLGFYVNGAFDRSRLDHTLADDGVEADEYTVKEVKWTADDLAQAVSDLSPQSGEPADEAVSSVAAIEGGVEVRYIDETARDRLEAKADRVREEWDVPIALTLEKARPGPTACNSLWCDPPLRGGVEFDTYWNGGGGPCSTGPMVFSPQAPSLRYFLTAGHCTFGGVNAAGTAGQAGWCGVSSYAVCAANNGALRQSTWGQGGDTGLVQVLDANWTTYPAYRVWGGDEGAGVFGARDASLNDFICHSGRTTGTSCGTIGSTSVDVNYSGIAPSLPPATAFDQMRLDGACNGGGDSGGIVYSPIDGFAVGTDSGGAGCPTSMYFEKISRLQSVTGTLVLHL